MTKKCKIFSAKFNNDDLIIKYTKNLNILDSNMNPNKLLKTSNKIHIPNIKTYRELLLYNYNIEQLKKFAEFYNLKKTGKKNDILLRIYYHLYLSSYIIKIQKVFRAKLVRQFFDSSLHGPAFKNRELCTNVDDFISMEPIKEIPFNQFISYEDTDKFIYGFDITSLYNLFTKSFIQKNKNKNKKEITINPYNRNIIPDKIFHNIEKLIRIGKILNFKIQIQIEDEIDNKNKINKSYEDRVIDLFHNIDLLGNYTSTSWFLSLTQNQIFMFLRELSDIWNYRANLSQEIKINICPPFGLPFSSLPSYHNLINNITFDECKTKIIEVLEKFVNSGINDEYKSLGASYILCALTLVNQDAAEAFPWLYESVSYNVTT